MKAQERLHTDEKLKSITLKQIAIDAEKWPRKQVEQFFERQGLKARFYNMASGGRIIRLYYEGSAWSNFIFKLTRNVELTLPDALRWEELKTVECKDECTQVSALQIEVAQLRAKIAQMESEKKPEEEDRRFDFGSMVTFTRDSDNEAFIGWCLAKRCDFNKVLIAGEGYKWVLEEDYFEGRNAVSLVKTDEK